MSKKLYLTVSCRLQRWAHRQSRIADRKWKRQKNQTLQIREEKMAPRIYIYIYVCVCECMYPVASAIKVVLHRAFRASTTSQVTLANNFFKTSVLCACQGSPMCILCVWVVWIVSLYLYSKIVLGSHAFISYIWATVS